MLIYLQMLATEEERDKFTRLYDAYRALMFHAAYRVVKQTEDAEDAVHQAFLSVLRHLSDLSESETEKTKAFLVLVARRKAMDLLKARGRHETVPLDDAAPEPVAPAGPEADLTALIQSLPEEQRHILFLWAVYGYSPAKIAGLLGMTPAAVYKQLQRGRARLKAMLEEETS